MMPTPCRDWEAMVAARAAGEDLPGSAGLDAHLGSCAACREALEAWRAMAALMSAHPVPADPTRRARVGRGPRRFLPLAAAATVLLGLGLWLLAGPRPQLQGDPGEAPLQGHAESAGGDWRVAWLEPSSPEVVEAPGIPQPEAGVGSPGGMGERFGARRGKGGDGGTPPRPWAGALAVVQGQVPFRIWVPDLPEGLALAEARIIRPGPGRLAALLRFRDGDRELVLMEEPGTSAPPPLPDRAGWRSTSRLKDGVAITLTGKGLNEAAWETLAGP